MNRLPVGMTLFLVAAIAAVGCPSGPRQGESNLRFREVTGPAGIRFRHSNGASGKKFMPETFGGGVCLLDYDADGDVDIYFVNSADLPGYRSPAPPRNSLYRNDGDWKFVEVTGEAGVGDPGYGMGCTAGDYDNDGDTDLYVVNFGANVLYENLGNGRFREVTGPAGVGDSRWGASAAFADFDGDGNLDLFITNYLDYAVDRHRYCGNYRKGYHSYCPDAYDPAPDVLYRNRGDGSFEDVSVAAGVADDNGKGLGVVWGDYDNDGDADLYVANDISPNFLYRNNGDGTFTDVALAAGVAYGEDGKVQAGMGTDFGDYDNDGNLDIFVTNFDSETNSLYRNSGNGVFSDQSFLSGLGEVSLRFLGFGTDFADFDNDGDLDLFVNNGHILDDIAQYNDAIGYEEPNQLFENLGDGRFRDASAITGDAFRDERVGRGSATGDLDNDGDLDLVIVNLADGAQLYENIGGGGNHWLVVSLVGRESNRDGIGARIRLIAGSLEQVEEVRSGSSYLSQNDMRVHFGLGPATRADLLEIRWPSGRVERLRDLPADRFVILVEGEGAVRGVPV
ncbi:MAG: CRTAC1 family protein, partial [Acidobacteriota bacterium]